MKNFKMVFLLLGSIVMMEASARPRLDWVKPRLTQYAKCYKYSGLQPLYEVPEIECKEGFVYQYAKPAFKFEWACYKMVYFENASVNWSPVRVVDDYFCDNYGVDVGRAVEDYESGRLNYF